MNYKIVIIDNTEYKIEKLPLGKYAELLELLDKIPQQLSGFDGLSEEKLLQALPKMLGASFQEITSIISLGSGIPKETIVEKFGLTDTAKIVSAIFEVNEFKELGKVIEVIRRPKESTSKEKNG